MKEIVKIIKERGKYVYAKSTTNVCWADAKIFCV